MPLLAIVAYSSVLPVGFLGDDFLLLGLAREPGFDLTVFLPGSRWFFYRPVGVLFTWELGWELWGYNPLPFHITQLLIHAACALILGLWLAYATGRTLLGWLGGAVFAVFPAHGEAVGWIAAQWDVLAALFGLGSLWCFTDWWRASQRDEQAAGQRSRRWGKLGLYLAALMLYALAIHTKETLFTFLLVLPISAWFVAAPVGWKAWRRLGLVLLPFGVVLSINLALRIVWLGNLGNYPFARSDYGEFAWDAFLAYLRFLLAPLNPSVWGNTWVQVVGLVSTLALLLGLIVYGRVHRRLFLVGVLWVVLGIIPVLNLPVMGRDDFRDTRFLYLPAAGYSIIVATLLCSALGSVRWWRHMPAFVLSCLFALSALACWVQTSPWRAATTQLNEIVGELLRFIPPQPRPDGMVWFVENVPERYKGALMLNWGLGLSRVFMDEQADYPRLERVADAAQAPLEIESRDAYAIRFVYTEEAGWKIGYLAGLTGASQLPSAAEAGTNLTVWDFRGCAPDAIGAWQAQQSRGRCERDRGLVVEPADPDPQLIGPALHIPTSAGSGAVDSKARFWRVRASVLYPPATRPEPYIAEWFWKGAGSEFGPEHTASMPIKQDGQPHVYWIFIPVGGAEQALTGLRFDPVNGQVPFEVHWIALDSVR